MDKQFLEKLGQKLGKERCEKDISIEDLALKCRVTKEYMQLVEFGRINVPIGKTIRILKSLNLDFKQFFRELHDEYIAENKEHHLFDKSTWTDEKTEVDFKPNFIQLIKSKFIKNYDPYIEAIENGRLDPPITHFIRMIIVLECDFLTFFDKAGVN
jgi:transcriptional regulator with XRE-family HTH domain